MSQSPDLFKLDTPDAWGQWSPAVGEWVSRVISGPDEHASWGVLQRRLGLVVALWYDDPGQEAADAAELWLGESENDIPITRKIWLQHPAIDLEPVDWAVPAYVAHCEKGPEPQNRLRTLSWVKWNSTIGIVLPDAGIWVGEAPEGVPKIHIGLTGLVSLDVHQSVR